jgi:hypothetical protein
LKSPRWQGKSKLTTLEIGALQSWGDSRLAVTLNTCKAPSIKKKNTKVHVPSLKIEDKVCMPKSYTSSLNSVFDYLEYTLLMQFKMYFFVNLMKI